MVFMWMQLVCMLVIILIAAAVFTNAIEHFGQDLGISAGVTGSIFAAIATALPETSIPVLAMVIGTQDKTINEEISVGAILGAPLMLSTLSLFILGLFAMHKRGFYGRITPEKSGYCRDLDYFLVAFILALIAMYVPNSQMILRIGLSILLVCLYSLYLYKTFAASSQLVSSGHGVSIDAPMYLCKLGFKRNRFLIYIQILLGLALLVLGAKGFIHGVEHLSKALNISALLLSLLIIPIATELPEKVNSIMWVQQNKDTLAIGNITGAMVFQGALLPALGIFLTPWQPSKNVTAGIVIAFLAALWLRVLASKRGIPVLALFVNGGLYLSYLCLTLLATR